MLDVLIKNGTVVDGTGTPGRVADVGIRDGRIVAIGRVDEPAHRTIDADGKVVAPGFVDVHTHYDAQVFCDTTLSPSPLHGVTTVIGGNCGFTIAPLGPDHGDYLMRMLARVEGMPLAALAEACRGTGRRSASTSTASTARSHRTRASSSGHSTIRRVVMGERATKGEATADDLGAMEQLLAESLAAGALGFSSSWARTHNDGAGDMVPSRYASDDELIALCKVVGRVPRHDARVHPGRRPVRRLRRRPDDAHVARRRPAAELERAVRRQPATSTMVEHNLAASDYAAERGGRVLALTMPDAPSPRICFDSGFLLDTIPGWQKPMALPHDEKKQMLATAEGRAALDGRGSAGQGPRRRRQLGQLRDRRDVRAGEQAVRGPDRRRLAREQDRDPFDVALRHRRRRRLDDRPRLRARARARRRLGSARESVARLARRRRCVRRRRPPRLPRDVQLLDRDARQGGARAQADADGGSDPPADRRSGPAVRAQGTRPARTKVGTPTSLSSIPRRSDRSPVRMRFDLPTGAPRLFGGADGIDHVLVNGTEIVDHGEFTDARPGTVFRSGRDTETVTASGK